MAYDSDGKPWSDTQFLSGVSALVELPILQRRHDQQRGWQTAGLVSGYRGSPLGTYDQHLWRAKARLDAADVVFQPGLNEDLAATALWGSQMHRAFGETRVDGVFGIWYGKGPGVDRSGDVFRNANILGTSGKGGVLAIGGDDHAAQSSMFPHQTDGIFQSVMMPVLQPASVQEIIDLGIAGIELSRASGLWVGFKTIAEVVESTGRVSLPEEAPVWRDVPECVPPHGLNWDPEIAWPAQRVELERRLIEERLPAASAWIRANGLNHVVAGTRQARLVLATAGKAHQDTMQALQDLGLDDEALERIGIGVFKFGCTWPVDATEIGTAFPDAEEILVIEEKVPTIEDQLKAGFYRASKRPRIVGKTDESGAHLLRQTMEFSPVDVAKAIARRLRKYIDAVEPSFLVQIESGLRTMADQSSRDVEGTISVRKPFFCAGCPHNTSTRTPDGSIAGGGIGCHVMVLSQTSRKTSTFCQMGGEGAQWIGASPFSRTGHIFQNLGDGTYEHSGILAIRAAVAANTNITYKILFNDAVAMTGGQPLEGSTNPLGIARQLYAERVREVVLVSDDPSKWQGTARRVSGLKIHHRDEFDAVQRRLREVPGVTAIIYEQTCAAEKRRRRKRREIPDPPKRVFINARVCEGCGDCSIQSNCIAIEPVDTPFGRKRRISQSGCNKDFSCVKGFCPSFVELEAPQVRSPSAEEISQAEKILFPDLPDPETAPVERDFNIYVSGIGGLGVLTLGALLGRAAEMDGLNATVLDFTGLAQKNGAVVSHVRIAPANQEIYAARIPDGMADLLLASDALVAASVENVKKLSADRTAAVINTDEVPTADTVEDGDFRVPNDLARARIERAVRTDQSFEVPITTLAEDIFGNSIAGNMMILGYAWQRGLVPVSREAIQRAIQANRKGADTNLRSFNWGRAVAHDGAKVRRFIRSQPVDAASSEQMSAAGFAAELEAYQDRAYADRYMRFVARVRDAVAGLGDEGCAFAEAVERNAFKLMAYKDEYEVARLYAAPEFGEALRAQFSSWKSCRVWLAPPGLSLFSRKGSQPVKRRFGPWVFVVFRLLTLLRRIRGTPFDLFGYSQERKFERVLREDYLRTIEHVLGGLRSENLHIAMHIASLPDDIRGFGHIKEESLAGALQKLRVLKDTYALNSLTEPPDH